ncbi:hypothetical protein [Bacillus sp. RO1]|uniref:hypothetical protein n=1 Tax=Bacillus sp. RO1 TaxID=2722703 RepID=UPI001456725A|nr:hypothetical protein [Bacillus sp. RO1]NLP51370.1 hypothetical protein [Bacillus sp. RO1]
MKTSSTREKEKRGPHRGDEDPHRRKKRRRKVFIEVMKTSSTRKKEKRGPHRGHEDLIDEKKGEGISNEKKEDEISSPPI